MKGGEIGFCRLLTTLFRTYSEFFPPPPMMIHLLGKYRTCFAFYMYAHCGIITTAITLFRREEGWFINICLKCQLAHLFPLYTPLFKLIIIIGLRGKRRLSVCKMIHPKKKKRRRILCAKKEELIETFFGNLCYFTFYLNRRSLGRGKKGLLSS